MMMYALQWYGSPHYTWVEQARKATKTGDLSERNEMKVLIE